MSNKAIQVTVIAMITTVLLLYSPTFTRLRLNYECVEVKNI